MSNGTNNTNSTSNGTTNTDRTISNAFTQPPGQDASAHRAAFTSATMTTSTTTTASLLSRASEDASHLPQTNPAATTVASTPSTSIAATAATATAAAHVVSQKTVEALGDWLLESASVHSVPAAQEQRRKQSYKSSAIISKTMKQSQEERRRQALAEQAKKRYQFTNHARKLALFASGQSSEGSSDDEDGDIQDDDEDEEDDDEDEDDEDGDHEQDNNDNIDSATRSTRRKKKRSSKQSAADVEKVTGETTLAAPLAKSTAAHKRRLSSESEPESVAGRKTDRIGDVLSPKKPRLQKKPSSKSSKKKKMERNPFRHDYQDQLMIPEAMADIPIDLDTSYYIVPLPIGHRCFVISADGKTTARLPSGQLLVSAFESCLPAGSSQYRGNRRSDYCILDCVYSSVTRTFWTLDIMCWRGHPVYECETEFRFWWLRGKLAEIEGLQGKWVASQTKEWEQEMTKKRLKRARQIKKRQEKAAAAATTAAMDVVPVEKPEVTVQEEVDDGDDEAGTESMDVEDNAKSGPAGVSRRFWPVVFTPLPYFNASIDLVRLLAESMYQPAPSQSSSSAAPTNAMSNTGSSSQDPSLVAKNASMVQSTLPSSSPSLSSPATTSTSVPASKLPPATKLSSKPHPAGALTHSHGGNNNNHVYSNNDGNLNNGTSASASLSILGTMALSGEIATAAALFPAHDNTQKIRQDQTLLHERAAGLVFFNKKTMYVLGTTPLCGWVTMEQIGDVFFGEEGGIGPVPGTSAVEGREVEMEDALERIRI